MGRHNVIEGAGLPARLDQFPNVSARSDQIDVFDQGDGRRGNVRIAAARFLSVSESTRPAPGICSLLA